MCREAKELGAGELRTIATLFMLFLDPKDRGPLAGFAAKLWRLAPPSIGFFRWQDKEAWESLLKQPILDPDWERLMIDASHTKVHPHAAGAKGDHQDMIPSKGGSKGISPPRCIWPWMGMVCRSKGVLHMVPQLIARRL